MKPKTEVWILNGEIQNTGWNYADNRGFAYADGLFETMIAHQGKIDYWTDHLERLLAGLQFLEISPQKKLLETLPAQIKELIKENGIQSSARVKLTLWRNSGGLYTPTEASFSYVITATPFNEIDPTIESLSICSDLKLPKSPLGNFKTINSLYYVKAGLFKSRSKADDLILLNTHDEVCECTSSNLFWKKNEVYYTPALETGCIAGIMRKNFLKQLQSQNKKVVEGIFTSSDLVDAHCYYLTNVTGIRKCLNLIP